MDGDAREPSVEAVKAARRVVVKLSTTDLSGKQVMHLFATAIDAAVEEAVRVERERVASDLLLFIGSRVGHLQWQLAEEHQSTLLGIMADACKRYDTPAPPAADDVQADGYVDDVWTDCGRCGARFPTSSTCMNHDTPAADDTTEAGNGK